MRAKTYTGDILSVESGVILQQVNAQCVMGSGVAKAIKAKYPSVFEEYVADLAPLPARQRLGRLVMVQVNSDLHVGNLVGQEFYGRQVVAYTAGGLGTTKYTSYDALDSALLKFRRWALGPIGINEAVHYPLLGAGLGGGHWPVIREILNCRLDGLEHHLWLMPGVVEPV